MTRLGGTPAIPECQHLRARLHSLRKGFACGFCLRFQLRNASIDGVTVCLKMVAE
jgi:hypothetical protein